VRAGAPETAPRPAAAPRPENGDLATVVVPAFDEEACIEGCLSSILGQDHAALQVVVIDGGSTDGTRRIVEALRARDPRIELLTNPSGRIPVSLNLGLAAARGRWLVRVDAHSTVPPDYVRVLVGHLVSGRWGGVGGRKDGVAATRTGRAIAAALGSRAGVGNSAYHYAELPQQTDHVPFGAYPVRLLRELGGWDEDLEANEDYELDLRIRRDGHELLLDPAIRIRWRSKETIGALAGQYRRYGRGKADVARKHPSSLGLRHLAAPLLVAGAIPWSIALVLVPWVAAALAAVYAALILGASIVAATKARDLGLVPTIAAALTTMHVAWGVGFWEGLLRGTSRTETRTRDDGGTLPA
jgi:glycosyltransferase involved in cell wall biosynthesis